MINFLLMLIVESDESVTRSRSDGKTSRGNNNNNGNKYKRIILSIVICVQPWFK